MKVTSLPRRVLARLEQAEANEADPWLRDDLRIARLTVLYAATGEAVECSPHVLASYEVLGLHPEKVWPAIQARRKALGPIDVWGAAVPVPKKPPQSVTLWCENTNAARATNSRRADTLLRDNTISVPMAAPSIAALYPKPDEQSSAKKREFSYDELLVIVRKSFAPASIIQATINALTARGRWPKWDGPVDGIICVSLDGMMLGGPDGDRNCVRSTARWRARRAVKLGYWRLLRPANSWSNCPKCGTERRKHSTDCQCGECPARAGTCPNTKCGYQGRARTAEGKANFDEFCRPFMYEIDIEKFRHAPPAKGIRHFDHRAYQDHKAAAKRGEHPNVTEMPRKPAQPTPQPTPDPPLKTAPKPEKQQPAAEHHRGTQRPVVTEISARLEKAADLLLEMCGLPDTGAAPFVAAGILAEAKFSGIELEDAAKLIAECVQRDQRRGASITRFYFRDAKWRSNGAERPSAGAERSERSKRNILNGILRNARGPDAPDGPERKE